MVEQLAQIETQIAGMKQQIDALSAGYGVEMKIFTTVPEAEAWLDRPLTLLV